MMGLVFPQLRLANRAYISDSVGSLPCLVTHSGPLLDSVVIHSDIPDARMFSRPKILFLVSLLFVALLNSIPTYLLNF